MQHRRRSEIGLHSIVKFSVSRHVLGKCAERTIVSFAPDDCAASARVIPALKYCRSLQFPAQYFWRHRRQFKTILIRVPCFCIQIHGSIPMNCPKIPSGSGTWTIVPIVNGVDRFPNRTHVPSFKPNATAHTPRLALAHSTSSSIPPTSGARSQARIYCSSRPTR